MSLLVYFVPAAEESYCVPILLKMFLETSSKKIHNESFMDNNCSIWYIELNWTELNWISFFQVDK